MIWYCNFILSLYTCLWIKKLANLKTKIFLLVIFPFLWRFFEIYIWNFLCLIFVSLVMTITIDDILSYSPNNIGSDSQQISNVHIEIHHPTIPMQHSENLEKLTSTNFKTWQHKMFYLIMLNLFNCIMKDSPIIPTKQDIASALLIFLISLIYHG